MLLFICGCTKTSNIEVTKEKSNEIEKTTLIYATYGVSDEISAYIHEFNRNNKNTYIEINDYSKNYELVEEGIQALKIDLVGMNSPDIIDLSFLDLGQMEKNSFLEDLFPYFESDFECNDFQWNAMEAGIVEDKLLAISPSFEIVTCVTVNENCIRDARADFSGDDFWNMIEHRSSETDVFLNFTRKDILDELLYHDLGSYVDWKSGECNFDLKGFRTILEIAKEFPKEIQEYDYDANNETEISRIKEGSLLFTYEKISSIKDLMKIELIFGDSKKLVGFPIRGICQNSIEPNLFRIGILSSSKYKEEAWSFIKPLLDDSYQDYIVSMNKGFPVRKKAMERVYHLAATEEIYVDENGVSQIIPKYITGSDSEYQFFSATDEQIAYWKNIIDESVAEIHMDNQILAIITKEAELYWNDDKTEDEVITLIQEKINLYVNENT